MMFLFSFIYVCGWLVCLFVCLFVVFVANLYLEFASAISCLVQNNILMTCS
jgi:hypothetical protein